MIQDTHPEAARVRWMALAARTPVERLAEALKLSDAVRALEQLGAEQRASDARDRGVRPAATAER